jgi:hypothetical protein
MSTNFKEVDPDKIFREREGRDIFGYAPKTLRGKIRNGTVPAPILLDPPPSRARGWYGWQINQHREKVAAQQEAWAAAHTDVKGDGALRYVPRGGDLRKETAKPKVEKVKGLKRPVRLPRRSAKG